MTEKMVDTSDEAVERLAAIWDNSSWAGGGFTHTRAAALIRALAAERATARADALRERGGGYGGRATVYKKTAKPYEMAVYEAVRALLRHGHFARLEIGPGETEGDITVGFHAGWSDGQFVVISDDGKTEWALDTCDGSVARELAAALTAYADWCDADADAFMARLTAERAAAARARAEIGKEDAQ